jgi:APA family basic amino acid/polyamine antiporter
MGALYAVGSLLAFMFAHASILGLRVRQPDLHRPFRLGWNIGIRGRKLPVSAIVGLLATSAIWVIILITQSYSRWVGLGWMCVGLVIYFLFLRRRSKKPSEEWEVKPPKKP